jgi:quercetin dioxygenase-like cupin family protein
MQGTRKILALYQAMVDVLAADRSGLAGVAEARRALAAKVRADEVHMGHLAPQQAPTCRHLPPALELARRQGFGAIAAAIAAADPFLRWVTYDLYPRAEIGEAFATGHAFAGVAGTGEGRIPGDDVSAGIFLIAPRTLYRDHRHPAPELYYPLTGPSGWRFDAGAWQQRAAGEPVWNEANAVHATRIDAAPLLMFYVWTRDVNLPAVVVPAPDWAEVEAGL